MENIMSSSCVTFRPKVDTDADWIYIFTTDADGCYADLGYVNEAMFPRSVFNIAYLFFSHYYWSGTWDHGMEYTELLSRSQGASTQ